MVRWGMAAPVTSGRAFPVVCYHCIRDAMSLNTRGVLNAAQLNRHYLEHGRDFGHTTVAEYEVLADEFLGGPKANSAYECRRSKGDILPFDSATGAYGVLNRDRVIRTFYRPCHVLQSRRSTGLPSSRLAAATSTRRICYISNRSAIDGDKIFVPGVWLSNG